MVMPPFIPIWIDNLDGQGPQPNLSLSLQDWTDTFNNWQTNNPGITAPGPLYPTSTPIPDPTPTTNDEPTPPVATPTPTPGVFNVTY